MSFMKQHNNCFNLQKRCDDHLFLQDVLEIQADAIEKGQKVVILDDLIATGGEYWENLIKDAYTEDNC